MEWSEEHDIILLREMISREIFSFKKGSPDRGKTWESIQEFLNQMENPKFHIKEKRGVQDRWNILQGKFLKRMREEEAASGIECEELSEKDTLIEELSERERSFQVKEKNTAKDKEAAESVRRKAMERMKDSKRKTSQDSDLDPGLAAGGKKSRKTATEVVDFLKEKAKCEQTQRQQEMELRRKELEENAKQQRGVLELMQRQSEAHQQINHALLVLIQKAFRTV